MADQDDQFARLVKDEFGEVVSKPGAAEDSMHREPEWFSLEAAIDQTEPEYEPWERFTPPTPPPLGRPRHPLVIGGLVAIGGALAVGVLWVVGVPVPSWVRGVGGLLIGVGLACLLFALPRRRQRDDDGAAL